MLCLVVKVQLQTDSQCEPCCFFSSAKPFCKLIEQMICYIPQKGSAILSLKKKKKANGDNFVVVTIISLMSKAEYSPYFWDCGREKL